MNLEYIEQYKLLHLMKKNYGMTSIKFYNDIKFWIEKFNIKSILDYGCGKSILIDCIEKDLAIKVYKYDPAIKEYANLPKNKVDFIICTDVLQHIPVFDLDRVLLEIKKYSNTCFFHIRCTEYKTILPNGKPANCTVYPTEWWEKKLKNYYKEIIKVKTDDLNTVTLVTKD